MKIYRVHHYTDSDSSIAFRYFSKEKEADVYLSNIRDNDPHNTCDSDITVYEFPVSKSGFIAALNVLGSHADNG